MKLNISNTAKFQHLFFFTQVSMVKIEGDKVVQQVSQDSGTVSITPPPKKFATGKRKAAPARFITPLQSIIAKEDDRIVLESTIDGNL